MAVGSSAGSARRRLCRSAALIFLCAVLDKPIGRVGELAVDGVSAALLQPIEAIGDVEGRATVCEGRATERLPACTSAAHAREEPGEELCPQPEVRAD